LKQEKKAEKGNSCFPDEVVSYGAVHLQTTTFEQWLCSGQIGDEIFKG
jgi:hypothetical protein